MDNWIRGQRVWVRRKEDDSNTGEVEEREGEESAVCRVHQKERHEAWMNDLFWRAKIP